MTYDKRFMHERSIRTPMLIRYPRMIRAGSTANQMVTNLDIAPTFLELAGIPAPKHMQGLSMVPILEGETPANWRKDWLYEYYEYPAPNNVPRHRGVRTDRYKYIHYYEQQPEEFELYDLKNDPGELHNLYGDARYASLANDSRRRLDELRRETDDHYVFQPPRR
jgi:arylsulfatase A-like enzyme